MKLGVVVSIILSIIVLIQQGCESKVVQFIIGDSLSDVGNNQYLSKSLAKANLPWYGIDFGNGLPNGRFCNGRTVADIIGDKMELPRPRAYLDPSLSEDVILENGINFASGGGGILNDTGNLFMLHSLGARRLIVFGLGPMGCIPLQRVLSTSGGCQDRTNQLAMAFNEGAANLVNELSATLPNASFKFGDAYDVVNDLITNPNKYGFSNSDSPCCSFGRIRPALTCIPASTLCKDRSKYVFWDEYHPTDSANELVANEMIKKLGFLKVNGTDNASSPGPAMPPSSND
nr:GDSL esterase/lipase At1g74460 [Ipomoea batatas]